MVEIEPIQFGSFPNVNTILNLEERILQLEQEKASLIANLVERERFLQTEKDEFIQSFSPIMQRKNTEINNIKKELETITTSFNKELENIKNDNTKLIEKCNNEKNKIGELQNEVKQVREQCKKLYEKSLQKNLENSKLINEIKELKTSVIIKPKMQTISIECNIENDETKRAIKTLQQSEKKLAEMDNTLLNSHVIIRKLTKELDEERLLSSNLNKTVTEKVTIMHNERDLRQDFEHITNTIRMYLELEMMQMNAAIVNSGFTEFAKVAYEMYKGYCEGKLETMLMNVIEERKKVPRSTKNPPPSVSRIPLKNRVIVQK